MHWEDILMLAITILIFIGLGLKAAFGAPVVAKIIGKVVKAATPLLAAKIAEELANLILIPLSEAGLLPANTTALSLV